MTGADESRRRGGPLAMLGVLLIVWVSGRAVLWENPFPIDQLGLPIAEQIMAEGTHDHNDRGEIAAELALEASLPAVEGSSVSLVASPAILADSDFGAQPDSRADILARTPIVAAGHQFLMAAAFKVDWSDGMATLGPAPAAQTSSQSRITSPAAPPRSQPQADMNRWSLDAFAFFRAGSNSNAISQSRVPVYGASQAGANLQYRLAPQSEHDPRAYLRGYRAFVPRGESEAAVGVSARPVGAIPVRLAAELRVTQNGFGTEMRPAAYAVTELPAQRLPFEFSLEAYGGAGYVGGAADTPYLDGQAVVTREIVQIDGPGEQPVRLSIGGGAWGGSQEDASRLDIGPTMRVDLTLGEVPARISVDWRERVAGDASPTSGIAATLSTRF